MKFFKGLVILVLLIGFVFLPTSVFAQENGESMVDSKDFMEGVVEVNSFELFWPIVAGRTMGDPLYFLKNLKEGVRGWFIFGAPQKADYSIFLATKRVVEAEKLINEGEKDLADKTLARVVKQLEKAEQNLGKAFDKGTPFQDEATNIGNSLSNLEIFVPWLLLESDENKEILTKVLDKVVSLNQRL